MARRCECGAVSIVRITVQGSDVTLEQPCIRCVGQAVIALLQYYPLMTLDSLLTTPSPSGLTDNENAGDW